MTTTGKVENEGAELVYDYEGSGPLLLTIPGGGGSAARYADISAILKDEYTVVRFDRRCQSRSTGDATKQLDMAQQARDAAAVTKAMNAGPAYVFGNSSGACIALKLAEDFPELLRGVIAHEPPIFALLPDAVELFAFGDKVVEIFKAQGSGPAMGLFMTKMVGFTRSIAEEAGSRIGDQSAAHNMDFFLSGKSTMSADTHRI
jgi:pimeloyl-ACP methyl ester carboxylesterase